MKFSFVVMHCVLFFLHATLLACPLENTTALNELEKINTRFPFINSGYKLNEFSLVEPTGVAISNSGIIYTLDSDKGQVKQVNMQGNELTVFGTLGKNAGMFVSPKGIAIDEISHIFIADTGNHRIQVFDKDGRFLQMWGQYGSGDTDLISPTGIAVDQQYVYVADTGNNRLVVYQKNGSWVRAFGSYGEADEQFNQPVGITTDGFSNIYIADSLNDRIKKFSHTGKFYQSWGARGSLPGQLMTPFGIAFSKGMLYVAELANHRIQLFNENGNYKSAYGDVPSSTNPTNVKLHYPASIAISANGQYRISCEPLVGHCESFNQDNLIAETVLEDSARWEKGPARFHYGSGVAIDENILAVIEPESHAIALMDATTNNPQWVATIGGFGSRAGQFKNPSGVAIDAKRNLLYVSDAYNHRIQVFTIHRDKYNRIASASFRLAYGNYGAGDGQFNEPGKLVKDKNNDVLILDTKNYRIQKMSSDFMVHRHFAAKPEMGISNFMNFSLSANNNTLLLIDDKTQTVNRINIDGNVLPALGVRTSEGRKRQEQKDRFLFPTDVVVDEKSNIYISDLVSQRIKKFDANGKYLTEWGTWGDGKGEFYKPKSMAIDEKNKRLVVIDYGHYRGQLFDYQGKYLGVFGIGHARGLAHDKLFASRSN